MEAGTEAGTDQWEDRGRGGGSLHWLLQPGEHRLPAPGLHTARSSSAACLSCAGSETKPETKEFKYDQNILNNIVRPTTLMASAGNTSFFQYLP